MKRRGKSAEESPNLSEPARHAIGFRSGSLDRVIRENPTNDVLSRCFDVTSRCREGSSMAPSIERSSAHPISDDHPHRLVLASATCRWPRPLNSRRLSDSSMAPPVGKSLQERLFDGVGHRKPRRWTHFFDGPLPIEEALRDRKDSDERRKKYVSEPTHPDHPITWMI